MKSGLLVAAIFITLCLQATGGAVTTTDAENDFLPTFTGTPNADLDVRSADVTFDPATSTFSFSGTQAGPIGTTPGAIFVFGLDRGAGTERFQNATPPIGDGISFDSVVILQPNGTGEIVDLLTGGMAPLPAGSVKVSGNTIEATSIPASLIPSEGLQPQNLTWNFWPRVGMGQNSQVSDFVPDASNAVVSPAEVVIPAPGALLLGALGTGLAGWLRRRRMV